MATNTTPGAHRSAQASPPVAPRRPVVRALHGEEVIDHWSWLRNREDPEVLAHLEAENAYTAAATAHLADLRERLFEEIRSRVVETDVSAPVRRGAWWYFTRTVAGLEYPIHCRVPVTRPDDPYDPPPVLVAGHPDEVAAPGEQLVLDENAEAAGTAYFALGALEPSPDHRLVALASDRVGNERYVLEVRQVAPQARVDDPILDTAGSVAWLDDRTLLYSVPDRANRPYQVRRHRIGTPATADEIVFEEPDERFFVDLWRSRDGAWVLVESRSKTTSETHLVPTSRPLAAPEVVLERRAGVEYAVEPWRRVLFVATNDHAPDFRLVALDPDASRRAGAAPRELVAHRPGVRLEHVVALARRLACFERLEGTPRVRLFDLPDDAGILSGPLGEGRLVPAAEAASSCWPGPNPDAASPYLRVGYSSLVTPVTTVDLELSTATPIVRKRQEVPGYDPDAYVSERRFVETSDGTAVPVSLVYRRDVPLDGSAPCLLYGYGAYEISSDPVFSAARLSLTERGFVFAIAHVRGGGELGRRWYEEGRLARKPNSFRDFVAAARWLVEERYTSPERLVARGGSAGGLLVAAALNLAPELFAAVVAEVPFVDCLNTMIDPTLPLTVTEWEEWGDPLEDPEAYRSMRSWSPYENVRPVRYPAVLATAGLEDPRVGYWEPAKWVQALRAAHPSNRALLHVELHAGHRGPSGRYAAFREEAFILAFILDAVGLAKAEATR
jgi:oligopeptidase B